jgi:hypothetical protein
MNVCFSGNITLVLFLAGILKILNEPIIIQLSRDLEWFLATLLSWKWFSHSFSQNLDWSWHVINFILCFFRMLKPFIRRDYESRPLKMRLLQEVISFPHRHDENWKLPPMPPIDYCYVRPEHIPSLNTLCREFFWPGIECKSRTPHLPTKVEYFASFLCSF